MLRLVVTARPIGPIADSSTTYMAKSASAISVGPEIGSARTQHLLAVTLPQQAGRAVGAFDRNIAAAEGLREFGMEKPLQLRHAHFCNCHVVRLPSSRLAPLVTLR